MGEVPLFIMAGEPPCAEPHAGWCGEGWREISPYPIYTQNSTLELYDWLDHCLAIRCTATIFIE